MPLYRLLPLTVLLLAGCRESAATAAAEFSPGVNCQNECAAGYRWAVERELPDDVKCRGESEFARGCREAVAFMHPFGQ